MRTDAAEAQLTRHATFARHRFFLVPRRLADEDLVARIRAADLLTERAAAEALLRGWQLDGLAAPAAAAEGAAGPAASAGLPAVQLAPRSRDEELLGDECAA